MLAAAAVGAAARRCSTPGSPQPAVNDVAAGIAMIIFGSGLAFFFGKRFVAPMAPQLPLLDFGGWSRDPAVHSALRISPLFFLGIASGVLAALVLFKRTRWGLQVRAAGDDPQAARAPWAFQCRNKRMRFATMIGGALAASRWRAPHALFPRHLVRRNFGRSRLDGGRAGDFRALESPPLSRGGAAVRAAHRRWDPRCNRSGITGYYHLFNASPYLLTLAVMIASCSPPQDSYGNAWSIGRSPGMTS